MALRPLYMGLQFYLPQNHAAAVAHARYMISPKKEELVRLSDPSIHARYMVERPGSAGLFGPDPDYEPDVSAMGETIQHHTGPVWRLIVSVTEDDARVLAELSRDSLLQRTSWEQACRLVMPQIGAELGLAGLDWAAAMHRKEGHPHIHLLFWEPGAHRVRGQVSTGERRQMRKLWMRELYRPVRELLQAEKHQVREALREAAKEWGSWPSGIAVKLSASERRGLAGRLLTLAGQLPTQGRLALAYMPEPVKHDVRDIAAWTLDTIPEYRMLADRYQELAQEMAQHQSDNETSHQQARSHAKQDLVNRMSPILLRLAATWEREHGRLIRTSVAQHTSSAPVDAQVIKILQTGVRQMVHQNVVQRKEIAHRVVQSAMDGQWSAREQARTADYLVTVAAHAQARLVDGAADLAQELFRGLFDEMAEWEQVARFIREDRTRRRGREVMAR